MNDHQIMIIRRSSNRSALLSDENFVVVTGIDAPEDDLLIDKFKSSYPDLTEQQRSSLQIITASCSMSDRRKIYAKPNVLFISGRILVVDLLANRIPVHKINGLIVLNAHRVVENCLEAFICRLFRSKNRSGFIKGMSETAHSFCSEINRLDRAMRYMFLKRLSLWPRFHVNVTESFQKRASPEVIELRLPLTELMKKIQYSLMQLISTCLKEIARSNLSILCDFENLSAENVICWNLRQYYARHFYPIWHQLNPKTKRTLDDIKLLKRLLFSLTSDDCVTFYQMVTSIQDGIKSLSMNSVISDWIFWEPTEVFFVSAKKRLELPVPANRRDRPIRPDDEELFGSDEEETNRAVVDDDLELATLENNQKWDTFYDVMQEIKASITSDQEMMVTVFVLVENDRTAEKLEQVLESGSRNVLREMLQRKKKSFQDLIAEIQTDDSESQNVEDAEAANPDDLSQGANANVTMMTQTVTVKNSETGEDQQVLLNVVFHCFRTEAPLSFENKLYYYKPWYTIFYDYNIACIRMLEVYQAAYCSPKICRIYLLIYDGSAEEQKYFSNLKLEKDNFERLIREKCSMVIPVERDGRSGLNLDLIRGQLDHDSVLENSHRDQSKNLERLKLNENLYFCEDCLQQVEDDDYAMSSAEEEDEPAPSEEGPKLCAGCHRMNRNQVIRQKVIVDMREFRSVLPAIIHKRGLDVVPATISIGDYILTPDVCVERKSISDLTQSLQSGRLYSQCKMMLRHYKKAFLLIEFDQKRSFSMKGKYWSSDRNDTSIQSEYNIMSKLILLCVHFPRLKLIWSPTPEFSAEVFEQLKQGKEEPTVKKALNIGDTELDPEYHEDRFDLQLKDFLIQLNGVNLANVHRIMNGVENVAKLVELSKEQLIKLLDSPENGSKLHAALHENHKNFCANGPPQSNRNARKVFKKL